MKYRYIIGVDEVGRGPLAGPVTVGVVCVPVDFNMDFLKGIKDSKKLSPQKRKEWQKKVKNLNNKFLQFSISSVSAEIIDKIGINQAITKAINRSLKKILGILNKNPKDFMVLLDGGLRVPKEYIFQKTIIKGDEKEPIIALASIFAKIHRDTKMERFSKIYQNYGFEKHKGYGTSTHLLQIRKLGMSPIHRRSFLKKFHQKTI